MTRALRWWMSCPREFKHAAAGIVTPYVLMGLLYWLAR